MNKISIKKNKRAILLIIYAFLILALFLYIIFIAPDHLFEKKKNVSGPTTKSLQTMQEELLKNNYEYKLNVFNIIGTKSITYKCSGKREEEKEEGTCFSPQTLNYTEETKKEILKEINTSYLEPEYIFNLIEEIKPRIEEYQANKIYTYKVVLNTLDTEITLITDKEQILEIRLNNIYETYNITYIFSQY